MLEEQIYNDYIKALKAKDKNTSTFLSFIRSALKNRAIDLKKDKLDDEEAITVLTKERKRLRDARETISNSQRSDALGAIEQELKIIGQYLPQEIDTGALMVIIDEAISQEKASSIKEMGKVIKHVLAKVGAQADAKTVSELVKQKLASL